jgi:outer membrane scaffolding protein for murein synthesis (MipA/OmpV family)
MQTYFGITPAQAAASTLGLAPYAAASGVKSYGLGLSIVSPISGPWGIAAIANVNRLTGDAEDSPIVATHGSETQFTAGLFLSYRF